VVLVEDATGTTAITVLLALLQGFEGGGFLGVRDGGTVADVERDGRAPGVCRRAGEYVDRVCRR
jgi:hypothetical protein